MWPCEVYLIFNTLIKNLNYTFHILWITWMISSILCEMLQDHDDTSVYIYIYWSSQWFIFQIIMISKFLLKSSTKNEGYCDNMHGWLTRKIPERKEWCDENPSNIDKDFDRSPTFLWARFVIAFLHFHRDEVLKSVLTKSQSSMNLKFVLISIF